MRNLLLAVLACSLLAQPAKADIRGPTALEGIVLLAAETALVMDGLQTLDIKHHPRRQEMNPILGPHPSDGAIVGYFVGSMLLAAGTWYMLPHRLRVLVPVVVLAIEVPQISSNMQVGASMAVRF